MDEPSSIGGLCPAGGYCPSGAATPASCPQGTYNNYTGATSAADCAVCPPGYFCAGSNNPSPSGKCSAGYFCNGSSSTPYQFIVPPGYFSIDGASAPTPCTPGTYQTNSGEASCTACPMGKYCDAFNAISTLDCTLGNYCPVGTTYPIPCPAGTFGEATGLMSTMNCTKCDNGFYCDEVGQTAATQKPCAAGFWCGRGSSREKPVDTYDAEGVQNGNICPLLSVWTSLTRRAGRAAATAASTRPIIFSTGPATTALERARRTRYRVW